jgi:hypothetical protein
MTELLVVIAISTVVVAIGFLVLNLLSKNVNSIGDNYNTVTRWQLFEEQLSLDFHLYPSIQYSKFSDKLVFSSPLDSVTYKFDETFILRGQDTIHFTFSDKTVYFAGVATQEGAIDAIKLITSEEDFNKELFLYKRSDAITNLRNGN